MVTLLFYYPAAILAITRILKRELSQFASQHQQVRWVLPWVHLGNTFQSPPASERSCTAPWASSFPGLFSNAILTVKNTNCEGQWEGSYVRFSWRAEHKRVRQHHCSRIHTLYNGVMHHALKWLPRILLSFHMAACESRNKDPISTMN